MHSVWASAVVMKMEHERQNHQVAESRVLVIMTGGTICMKKSPNGFVPTDGFLESGMAPRPSFNDGSNPVGIDVITEHGARKILRSLRTPISTYQRHVRYVVLEFNELLDSSSIDAKGWTEIAQTIFRNYRLFDGFVVLHGTDSLAYTCSALSFMLHNLGKPVILTGSQAPMLELQNDATDNLLGSLIIAGHFMIPEVCLFFNYKLFRGNRATKVSASSFDAFASPNFPPLATITSSRTLVSWELVHRPANIKPFSIQTKPHTAHVACLRVFPGIKPEMVEAVLKMEKLRGLVLESFGSGNAPGGPDGSMTKVIAAAVKRGIVVVNISQCERAEILPGPRMVAYRFTGMSGSVTPLYEPAMILSHAGVVPGYDLTSEAALTKLSYLLALPDITTDEVMKQMSISLRGEHTEHTQHVFEHPSSPLPLSLANLSALDYAIANGEMESVQQILMNRSEMLLNAADYSGNTPMVGLPTPTLLLCAF